MNNQTNYQEPSKTKFCIHCGAKIPFDAVICTACGRQVEEIRSSNNQTTPNIVITNTNTNANVNANNIGFPGKKRRNKWVSLALCLFLGFLGGHKFYEGKAGMGLLYIFTGALFGIGFIIDFIQLLFKPTYYYV